MAAKVRFILGRSGSGKSHAVFERIRENELAGRRSLLIVPDRATFEAERMLSRRLGGGILNTSVLSFTRLAQRVLAETGNTRAYLTDQGRLMLIRRVLDEKKNELTAFSRVGMRSGFAEECAEIILKFKRFSLAPEEISSAEGLPERLRAKLNDFALIYRRLLERTANRYIDGEDLVNSLIERLPLSSVCGAEVFVDAPDMLNEQSARIIETLFALASSVSVTLRADPAELSAGGGLFAPDIAFLHRLEAAAAQGGCTVERLLLTTCKRQVPASLMHLEKTVFAYSAEQFAGDARELELHSSRDRLREVEEAAARILSAVHGGMRFREIAVALGDPGAYLEPIRRIFTANGIPFFMDAKRRVAAHPIAELLLSALRCAEKGFRAEDFIRVFKTGLAGISDDDAERLENHILRFGLVGKRLTSDEPSVKNAEEISDFDVIEAARRTVAAPLLRLRSALRVDAERSASSRIEALFDYMNELGVAERLTSDCEELAKNAETLAFAQENRQIYDKIVELLDQIYVILGDEPIGLARFGAVVREGLEAYEVGIIPTTLDQVLVGDVSGMHVGETPFLLVLGASEGSFPRVREDNSIINDRELALMREAGLNAWDSTESMDRAERLRVYSLLTRATRRLYLSFPRNDGSENSSPARLIGRLGEIFPHCLRSSGASLETLAFTEDAAFAQLASGLRRFLDTGEEERALAQLAAYFAGGEHAARLDDIVSACFEEKSPAPLGREAALRLYGGRLSGSASRLETFNKCPYRYMLQYGLELRERREHRFEARDGGTLVHDALDRLMKGLIEEKADFSLLTREEISKRLNEFLQELLEGGADGVLTSTATMRAELRRIEGVIADAAFAIVRQIAGGRFRPFASELGFGRSGDELGALRLEGSGGVTFKIRGVVDRLDTFTEEDGTEYFRIVDYKTGKTDFDYTALACGLRLQLPLYAAAIGAALSASRSIRTAGIYYMYIHSPLIENEAERDRKTVKEQGLSGPTLAQEAVLSASDAELEGGFSDFVRGLRLKKDGSYSGALLVSAEEMEKTLDFTKEIAKKTLDGIMEGRLDISPYRRGGKTACSDCPYLAVCRFDTTAGGRYRRIRAVTADKFFNRRKEK